MKKMYLVMPTWAVVVFMSLVCSCGNSGKSQVDEQAIKDSITKVVKDSIANAEAIKAEEAYNKTHSPEAILKRVKEIFGNDDYFSKDYKKVSKELQEAGDKYWPGDLVGPDYIVWETSQGGCGEGTTTFGEVKDITETTATIKVYNKFDCDEDHDVILHLVFENDDWYVDDISNCFTKSVKNDMKAELKNIIN